MNKHLQKSNKYRIDGNIVQESLKKDEQIFTEVKQKYRRDGNTDLK